MTSLRVLMLLAITLLPGCGVFRSAPTPATMPDAATQLMHWHISGKAGIRLRNEAHSAYVEWQQHDDRFDLLLFGPLGQGKSRLRGDARAVQLETAGGDIWRDSSPEALLERLYGWQLPVSRAQYWVKGLAAPGSPANVQHNSDGSLSHLEQDGWVIDYISYQAPAPALLPQKLVMRYDGVRVTLVIKQWQALAADP